MPVERALNILEQEVKIGKLDSDLFKLFVESKVYELIKKSSLEFKAAG